MAFSPDIVLFPHCDMHVALHGAPNLRLRVMSRTLDNSNLKYNLSDVTSSCTFDLFAPYNAVGNRLQAFVTIDPATGTVTPLAVGINFVQVGYKYQYKDQYIVARIQVHDTMLDWWFGNTSITTAKDANIAHAQPSIYALFSDDPAAAGLAKPDLGKTDLVGDITGHGYVPLTPSDPAFFTVNSDGRLQGLQEGANKTLSGTYLGNTNTLNVTIVDYGKQRMTLEYVQNPNVYQLDTMHNMLFIAEGFRDQQDDHDKFDRIVANALDEMIVKPRHAPYNLLQGSFNVWKAYEPSAQFCVTCGFRVNDAAAGSLPLGGPIPSPYAVSPNTNVYTVERLVGIVGLPLRGCSTSSADLNALWSSQTLQTLSPITNTWVSDFDPTKVDDTLIAAWKAQTSVGILEARDTFFGLNFGSRPGDRLSGNGQVSPPANDAAADANLAPFIHRIYEWFKSGTVRVLSPDPRRHPPELHAANQDNLGNTILSYIGNLQSPYAPNPTPNVGQQWIPDPTGTTFKRSRGLIAIITNDGVYGGANFNDLMMTAISISTYTTLSFAYTGTGTQKIMRRTPSDPIEEKMDNIINTVAHEFGHSFHLDDEYEEFVGDNPNAPGTYDNRCNYNDIQFDNIVPKDRKIDPDKVKWFELLRIDLADVLTQDSVEGGGNLNVTIDPRFTAHWVEAKAQNKTAYLRKIEIAADGQQLPLAVGDHHYLVNLDIVSVDEGAGTISLGGLELPPSPMPVYPAGSLLFLPLRDSASNLMFVVDKNVLAALESSHLPLNQDTNTTKINIGPDDPVDIASFTAPCKSYKVVGIYEGAARWTGLVYRPAGMCKMRSSDEGEFCHVCKYLIVQRVDPSRHAIMDKTYYPKTKKKNNG
jgi:hypothetical protein